MTPRPNQTVAAPGENIFKIYDNVRVYIMDEEALGEFDSEMDDFEEDSNIDDAEEFFREEILDYLNENVAPPNTLFGINAESGEIGFWDDELIGEEMEEDDGEEELPEEEEESPESRIRAKEEILEELLAQEDLRRAKSHEAGMEKRQAEVLDEEGKVITTTAFRRNPSNRVVCIVCKSVITGDPEAPEEHTTRGICEDCEEREENPCGTRKRNVDKEYLYKHFKEFTEATVDPEDQEDFEKFATPQIEEDPEYWERTGWKQMYNNFLDEKYGSK